MKKILSFALAAAAAVQLCIGGISASASEAPVVKKTYSIEQLSSFTPPIAEGSSSTSTRTFGVATYQIESKIYAYLPTRYDGLKVYDVTDPENVGAPIQTLTEIQNGDRSYYMRIETCEGKLFAFSSTDSLVHCMDINSDGTVNAQSDMKTNFVANCIDTAGEFIFTSANNTKTINVLNAKSETPTAVAASYTDTAENFKNIRAMKVRRLDNGIYRIAYILQQTETVLEINVVDYNPASGEFTPVCEKVRSDWITNGFMSIAFISDTEIVVPYYVSNKIKYYTVDFTDCISDINADCTITMEQEETAATYNAFMQEMCEGEIAAWHATSYIKDFTGNEPVNIASTTMLSGICDAAMTGDVNSDEGAVVYLAADSKVIIARVKRASVTEEPYTNNTVITVNPGEVKSLPAERLRTSVAAKVGDKTVVYGLYGQTTASLYAYDVTDGKAAAQLGNAITASNPKDAEMYVKDGYLIFGNGNNVQINKLNDDGSVGAQKYSYATGNSVASIRMADNLLFAGSMNANNGVTVHDISDPSSAKLLGTIVTDNSVRGIDIEKVSNIRYRVYILTKASVNSVDTLKLTIKDIIYALGSYSVESVFEAAIPDYTGFGWPGYNDYAPYGSGNIAVVKEGYIAVECEGTGRFTVDVTNPAAPKIINAEKTTNIDYRQRKIRLDSTKVVEVSRNTDGAYIVDYTNPAAPEKIAAITGMKGDGASILDKYLYTTLGNEIRSVKLYDDGVSYGNIVFDKAAVADEDTTAGVVITNNTANAVAPTLIIALYDRENCLAAVAISNENIAPYSAGTISATISKDFIPADTAGYYFKAMLWESIQTMRPIMNCETLGK